MSLTEAKSTRRTVDVVSMPLCPKLQRPADVPPMTLTEPSMNDLRVLPPSIGSPARCTVATASLKPDGDLPSPDRPVSTLPQTWQEHVQLRPSILSSGETVQASASVREPAPTPSVLVALCDNQGCSAVSKFVSRAPAKKRQLRGARGDSDNLLVVLDASPSFHKWPENVVVSDDEPLCSSVVAERPRKRMAAKSQSHSCILTRRLDRCVDLEQEIDPVCDESIDVEGRSTRKYFAEARFSGGTDSDKNAFSDRVSCSPQAHEVQKVSTVTRLIAAIDAEAVPSAVELENLEMIQESALAVRLREQVSTPSSPRIERPQAQVPEVSAPPSCDWNVGRVARPLERVMFGESPGLEKPSLVIDELLDSPSDREDLPLSANASARLTPTLTGFGPLAAWFVERREGNASLVDRVSREDEVELDQALALALATTRCQARGNRDKQFKELYLALQKSLGTEIDGLRCVPLDGDVARRMPPELSDPCVLTERLPSFKTGRSLAGSSLQRAKASVEALLSAGPAVFKIGITCSPLLRWRSYAREGYAKMHLIHAAEEPATVQMLEAALIDAFRGRSGCRNVASGGEGPTGRPPHFTYLALAPCGSGVGVGRARNLAKARAHAQR